MSETVHFELPGPDRFFVYPVILGDDGGEAPGTRLRCLSFDDALRVARNLVPALRGAVAVSARELAPKANCEEGEMLFADVAKFGEVSERMLLLFGIGNVSS